MAEYMYIFMELGFNTVHNLLVRFKELSKKIFLFLTVSSLFIGAMGFSLTFVGYLFLGIEPSIQMCTVVFLMTFSVYSLNKLTDIEEDAINMPERLTFLSGRKRLAYFCAMGAYLLSVVLAFLEKPSTVPIVFIPLAVNAVYSSKPLQGLPRLKDIPVMKNVSVAVSGALTCTLLPTVHVPGAPMMAVAMVFYIIMVKVFINTVLYDVRDVKGDRENGIITMPTLLGARKTTAVLLALNCTLLPILSFMKGEVRLFMAALILYGYIYILYFSVRRDPLVLDFFVDGEWTVGIILLNTLL